MAMIHAQDRGRAAAWLATLARAEAPPPIEVRALRADGEGGTLHVASLPGAGLAVTVRLPAAGAAQKVA